MTLEEIVVIGMMLGFMFFILDLTIGIQIRKLQNKVDRLEKLFQDIKNDHN